MALVYALNQPSDADSTTLVTPQGGFQNPQSTVIPYVPAF